MEKLAQLQLECDNLQEELTNAKSSVAKLEAENQLLGDEDRFIELDIERARDETYDKCTSDFPAKLLASENKHVAELVVASTRYEERCKEVFMLEAELEKKTKDVRDVGDDDNSGPSSLPRDGGEQRDSGDGRAYARKCKEVERIIKASQEGI